MTDSNEAIHKSDDASAGNLAGGHVVNNATHSDVNRSGILGVGGSNGFGAYHGVTGELRHEISEAQALLANMADILGDDAELVAATVEGETDLVEALKRATARVVELDGMIAGIGDILKSAGERSDRLKRQRERIKELVCIAMETTNMKRLETPLVTVSLRKVAPSVVVTDEPSIPVSFWKQPPPALDKRALLAALKDGPVAGATLSNGGQTVSFKAN